MAHQRPTSIAVLAGGKSTRLGTDKALVRLAPTSPPLLQSVLDVARSLSDDSYVVASNRPEYEKFGARVLGDLYPNAGVLGGIASGIIHARHDRCMVISCDHPFLSMKLLQAMLELDGDWDALVPVLPGESRQGGRMIRQTLHSIFRKSCLLAIERAILAGRLQTVSFFSDVRVRELRVAELERHDPSLRSFFSVNTPESLEIARRWRSERR